MNPSVIMVVGAPRSGTHLLAESILRNIEADYTGEINEVWKRHVATGEIDVVPARLATKEVVAKTRRDILAFSTCRRHLAEKTAANAFRLAFVHRVFPEARYLYIQRDGRDVALSTRRKMRGDRRKKSREDACESPSSAAPRTSVSRYLKKVRRHLDLRSLVRHRRRVLDLFLKGMGLRKSFWWGPRMPG